MPSARRACPPPAVPLRARALLTLALAPLAGAATPAQVTLPLERYEELRRAQERASVTVVDTLRVRGSLGARDLQIELVGRSAGRLPAEPVLEAGADVVLHACEGDGIVSRAEGGAFRLTPLQGRFSVRCRLSSRGSDRLELVAMPAVLWVEAAVSDGEHVPGEMAEGRRPFAVVRQAAPSAETLEPSAAGRYRITLLPDEARFRYQIDVRNPNRGRRRFELRLAAGEHVQQVDASAPYEVDGARYAFELPPGESALVLSGSLPGSAFAPPVRASLHYVLLESHPLLRAVVGGSPRRVGPNEVGLPVSFRGAQAFLLSGDDARLAWTATRLEALRTTSFAVRQARHAFFVSADGPALGESAFSLDNQGAPDLHLATGAEPTFASLQGEPVLLTKDAEGRLWLPIAQGRQELLVQHRQAFARRFGFATATLAVPQLPVPATRTQVELRYPADWTPLAESFAASTRVWRPGAGQVLGFVLLALWSERVLALLGLAARARRRLAAVLGVAGLAWWLAAWALVAALAAVTAVWLVEQVRRQHWSVAKLVASAAAVGLGVLFLALLLPSLLRARLSTGPADREYAVSMPQAAAPPAPTRARKSEAVPTGGGMREADVGVKAAADQDEVSYQGLPARFELPPGAWRSHFGREMLGGEAPRPVRVLLVSATVLGWLRGALVLLALGLVWRFQVALAAGWRARRDALRGPAPSAAA